MKKDPLIYLAHIVESIEAIQGFMAGVDREAFEQSEEKQSSVLRCGKSSATTCQPWLNN
jgi:uncharacterized protein with HEPN domain